MAGLNIITIVGRLGRDPEVRYSQGGMAICKLSVAVSSRVKNGETWEDETTWFRVTVFGKTAENAGKYLAKGREVAVVGRMREDKYKDKDGNERSSWEVIANQVQYVGGKGEGGGKRDEKPAETSGGFDDDSLPF